MKIVLLFLVSLGHSSLSVLTSESESFDDIPVTTSSENLEKADSPTSNEGSSDFLVTTSSDNLEKTDSPTSNEGSSDFLVTTSNEDRAIPSQSPSPSPSPIGYHVNGEKELNSTAYPIRLTGNGEIHASDDSELILGTLIISTASNITAVNLTINASLSLIGNGTLSASSDGEIKIGVNVTIKIESTGTELPQLNLGRVSQSNTNAPLIIDVSISASSFTPESLRNFYHVLIFGKGWSGCDSWRNQVKFSEPNSFNATCEHDPSGRLLEEVPSLVIVGKTEDSSSDGRQPKDSSSDGRQPKDSSSDGSQPEDDKTQVIAICVVSAVVIVAIGVTITWRIRRQKRDFAKLHSSESESTDWGELSNSELTSDMDRT